jgi:hypothetical protein
MPQFGSWKEEQAYYLAEGFQILTRAEFAPYLERFDTIDQPP